MHFDRQLLSTRALHATLEAHGLYNSFQFVLRLSPEIHRKLILVESPLEIASACVSWINSTELSVLMREHADFDYDARNLPVRVLFSHFLAFARDKLKRPEFFCWPGAWMTGAHVSDDVADLFESHSALFVDKEDDDGVFPRLVKGRSLENIQKVFDAFYAANLTYDLAGQWITRSGRFEYDYGWLSQSGDAAEIKAFADRNFEQVFGVWPDAAELLSAG